MAGVCGVRPISPAQSTMVSSSSPIVERAVGEFQRPGIRRQGVDSGIELAILKTQSGMDLRILRVHGNIAGIGTGVHDERIRRVVTARGKVKAGRVAEREATREQFPVGAEEAECLGRFLREAHGLFRPERPEVDVLDAAHIEALVHLNAAMQRLGIKPADVVPPARVCGEVHRAPRIRHEHVKVAQLSPSAPRPRTFSVSAAGTAGSAAARDAAIPPSNPAVPKRASAERREYGE